MNEQMEAAKRRTINELVNGIGLEITTWELQCAIYDAGVTAAQAAASPTPDGDSKLHRRCQLAETALADAQAIIERLSGGKDIYVNGSLGRALLRWNNVEQVKEIVRLTRLLERIENEVKRIYTVGAGSDEQIAAAFIDFVHRTFLLEAKDANK